MKSLILAHAGAPEDSVQPLRCSILTSECSAVRGLEKGWKVQLTSEVNTLCPESISNELVTLLVMAIRTAYTVVVSIKIAGVCADGRPCFRWGLDNMVI
jgi:hypothetical protein